MTWLMVSLTFLLGWFAGAAFWWWRTHGLVQSLQGRMDRMTDAIIEDREHINFLLLQSGMRFRIFVNKKEHVVWH